MVVDVVIFDVEWFAETFLVALLLPFALERAVVLIDGFSASGYLECDVVAVVEVAVVLLLDTIIDPEYTVVVGPTLAVLEGKASAMVVSFCCFDLLKL